MYSIMHLINDVAEELFDNINIIRLSSANHTLSTSNSRQNYPFVYVKNYIFKSKCETVYFFEYCFIKLRKHPNFIW